MADKIQFRRDTSANWASANPVLAQGELGLVTDTGAYKVGDGATAWNALSYWALPATVGMLTMDDQTDPSTPDAGMMAFYSRKVCGRLLPKYAGPSGLSSPLQPAIFQNSIWLVQPNTTSSVSAVGGAVTTTGTISTVTPTASTFGLCSNIVSAATAGSTAGTGQSVAPLNTSNTAIANGGFFCVSRLYWPDADYGSGATGSRHFVGVTSNTMAAAVALDNPAGSRMGFSYSTNLADPNWILTTKDGTSETRVDTGMPFLPNKLHDFYLFFSPASGTLYWRIDSLSDNVTVEGSTTSTLPGSAIYMRAGFQMATLTTLARNVRMKKLYVETDN